MTRPDADHADDPAADQASKLAATATREFEELKGSLERALGEAGVDTEELAAAAREKLTTVERLLKEELEHRPLRTLAVAVAIGALFGAILAR